jgi:hypothetical protein
MIRKPRWRRSSTAPHDDYADTTFEVIHPHHPLRGQKFKLVTYRNNWGEDRVYFPYGKKTQTIGNTVT